MRKIKCVICGKEFTTNHHSKKTCSFDCQSRNNKQLAKKSYEKIKADPAKMEELRERQRCRYKPISVCRICGTPITQSTTSTGHTAKRYHDDCIIKDCLSTIYAGKVLSHNQQLLLYSRGYTIKELKEEYIYGQDEV